MAEALVVEIHAERLVDDRLVVTDQDVRCFCHGVPSSFVYTTYYNAAKSACKSCALPCHNCPYFVQNYALSVPPSAATVSQKSQYASAQWMQVYLR